MSQEDRSRRSHRTTHISRKAQLLMLGGSFLVFAAGSASLAWALVDAQNDRAQTAPQEEQVAQQTESPTQTGASSSQPISAGRSTAESGVLKSPDELVEKTEPTESAASQAQRKGSRKTTHKKTKAHEEKNDSKRPSSTREKQKLQQRKKPEQQSESEQSPRTAPASQHARKTVKIRHTACKKTAVYRTRHHRATSAIESRGESDSPRRGTCPICGKRHKHGYTERVLDHYEYTKCRTCGRRHAHAYTEAVPAS